ARAACKAPKAPRSEAKPSEAHLDGRRAKSSVCSRHEDGRRPRALLGGPQTIVARGGPVVAVAGIRLDAAAFGGEDAAHPARVDHRGRLLDRAHVVDRLAVAGDEVRILELDRAAARVVGTRDAAPRVFDQRAQRLVGLDARADAHHLDAGDHVSLVARVVALAAAQAGPTPGREAPRPDPRAGPLLLGRAAVARAEVRVVGEPGLAAHRHGALGTVQQVEPEQDPLAARPVHLTALERVPDRLA